MHSNSHQNMFVSSAHETEHSWEMCYNILHKKNINHHILFGSLLLIFMLREAIKVEKKKSVTNVTLLVLTPLPPTSVTIHNLFFLSFWHHKEQLWSKSFFPLEKVKILKIISQNWPSEGCWFPPPTPPHKGEKFFFAFLDELGHSKHKIKSVIITSTHPPP